MSVEPDVDIKQELDIGEDSAGAGGYHETPRSWDSGVALDSVTALQMAEFQQVQSTRRNFRDIFGMESTTRNRRLFSFFNHNRIGSSIVWSST